MTELAQGLAFGLLLQISVGPVCLAVLGEAVTHGLRRALAMVLGVALVDAAYMALAATGIAALLQVAATRRALGLLGALVLVLFGVRALLSRSPSEKGTSSPQRSPLGSFALGVVLTAGNPLTVLFWTGAFASLIAAGRLHGRLQVVAFAAGCLAATLLFLTAVAWTARRLATLLRGPVTLWLDRAVGIALIAFGLRLLWAQIG